MSLPTEVFDNTTDTRNYVAAHIVENATRSITEEHLSNILHSILYIFDHNNIKIGVTEIEDGESGRLLYVDADGKLNQSDNLVFDDSNKRLGIGTGSPSSALDVVGSIKQKSDADLLIGRNTDNVLLGISLLNSAGLERGFFKINTQNGELRIGGSSGGYSPHFYSNGTEALGIPVSGNVQIKNNVYIGDLTTAPTARLDIAASTASIASVRFRSGVDLTSPSDGCFWYNGTNLYFQNDDTSIDLLASSSYEFLNGIMDYGEGYVGLGGDIFGTLELTGDDNIAIQTTGNAVTLKAVSNVNMQVGDSSYYRLNVNTSGIDYVRYDSGGYTLSQSIQSDGTKLRFSVGNFNYILTTSGTEVDCLIKLYNNPDLETGLLLGLTSDNDNVIIYEDGVLSINYGDYPGTAAMVLDAAGLIGIANDDPVALVDIAGSTTDRASLRVREGTAPSTKPDGIIWYDGTDLYFQNDSTTKKFTLTT